MTSTIEARLQLQEDITEIIRLKARYCRAADCGWDRPKPDSAGVADCFVADGVWDAGPGFARLTGTDAIRNYFATKEHPFGLHTVSNPIIHVDGDRATGQWQLLCPSIIENDQHIWIGGIYDDEFLRTPNGWRFKTIQVTIAFTSKADPGFDVVKTFNPGS